MNESEIYCPCCRGCIRIRYTPPLSSIQIESSQLKIPNPLRQNYNIQSLLIINEELGNQVHQLKARCELLNEFIETVCENGLEAVTAYQMLNVLEKVKKAKGD